MLGFFVCAALALTLVANPNLADEQNKANKGHALHGTILKVDAGQGTLTLALKSKKTLTTKEFTVRDDTKVVVFSGNKKLKLTGKDSLKNEGFKEGAKVAVLTDANDATQIKQLTLGKKRKKDQ